MPVGVKPAYPPLSLCNLQSRFRAESPWWYTSGMIDRVPTELDILAEVVDPEFGELSPESARAIMRLRFTARAVKRMDTLADRNRQGALTEAEQEEMQRYLRVGALVNLLQAKASLVLNAVGKPHDEQPSIARP